jgi:amino acid adenylation domain-containing protein
MGMDERMEIADREGEIAVVGMSGRFPGARDTAEFWSNLCAGIESVSFFSDDELLAAGIAPELLRDPAFVRAQGALADSYAFDAAFFGVNAREAEVMDPQHRVFLECAWSALEDAGYDPRRFPGAVGVFGGSGFSAHLSRVLANRELVASVGNALATFANGKDFLTTRVSYKLGLRGPSVAVQTACSTSLVAIHVACQSLLNRECDLALAGGVSIAADPVGGYLYQEGGILSPDGHCRAFDAAAAGTVGGSGAGVVVLKRMDDALRDGDAIRAVVKGSAINNDGAGKVGFTAPGVEGQAQAIAEALAIAGVEPAEVSYVETHGTGTALGDPIEIAALRTVFGQDEREAPCALGAVKTNIGHLDTAAGVAGFIKTVLALQHGAIPPTLHFQSPNPETGLADSPFRVNTALSPWTRNGVPRRAGVSSFGMGGTNAHAVLEEAPAPARSAAPDNSARLLVLSARDAEALERMRAGLAAHLAAHPELHLADVAGTLQEGRAAHPLRWSAAVRSLDDARAALAEPDARRPARQAAEPAPPVAFLFPGQGTQHAGMARALYEREPVFRREIDGCASALFPELGVDLRALLFPAEGGEDEANARLRETGLTQPALFAVEYALAKLWMSWGVRPRAMLGHSIGEYVAACLAGVFTLEAALRLVAARGRLMQSLPGGAMLAVPLPEAEVRALLPRTLSLAAVNSAAHCVVSGSAEEIAAFEEMLAARGVSARRLHTSHAFHSAAMEPVLAAFAGEVRRARPAPPTLPFLSNVTGDWITAAEATDPEYWARHLRETVRFADGVGRLLEDPALVLLEVGPGETLGTFARRHPANDGSRAIVRTLPRADEAFAADLAALEAAGQLWSAGVEVEWSALRRGERFHRVPLPTYPFARTVYRVPVPVPAPGAAVPAHSAPAAAGGETPPSPPMPQTVQTEAAAHLSRITASVTGVFARLLGARPEQLDPQRRFLDMGADSLLLMQVSRSVESEFGVRVPFRRLLEGLSTIAELSAHLADEVPPEPAAAPPSPPAAAATDTQAGPASPASPAPSVSPALSASPGTVGDDAGVREIVAQQLEIMRRQLELLGGAAPARPAEPAAAVAPAAASPAARTDGASSTPPPAAPEAAGAAHGPHRPVSATLAQGGGFDERQARHFEALVARYTARTRRSKAYAAENRGPLADNRAALNFRMATKELLYPVVGERSEGSRLWDLDGNEYVDFTMGFGVHFFGHRPPFVVEAVEAQLRRGFHVGPQSDLAGPAAALFRRMTGMERVTWCNTGSEAVMTALRVARAVTGRTRVALFEGAYHGTFDGILARPAAGGAPGARPRPIAPGTPQAMVDDVVLLPWGSDAALEYVRANGAELAAVLVEPVQSRNPELQPRDFLQRLRELTERSGTALVFDEMITGLRLGPTGAQGWYGVQADLATYGKVIGGGFPLGVLAGRARFMDAIDGGAWQYGDDSYPAADQTFFAGTFLKHPVAMAAAHAVLRHLEERGPALYDELHARTARLVAALRGVLEEEEVPIRILHSASFFRFVFRPDDAFVDLLFYHLLERGIYVWEGRGCFLSTAHDDGDCQRMVDALRDSIHALREGGFLPAKCAAPAAAVGGLKLFPAAAPAGARSFPLTPAQRQVWVHAQLGDDASRAYNEQLAFGLRGGVDVPALRAAVGDLVRHHEALRTVFDPSGEAQHVLDSLSVPVEVAEPVADDGALRRAMEEGARRVFDLAAGPLLRVIVHSRGAERAVVQLVVHHIVADGMSMGILRRDLETAYAARRAGTAPVLPAAMQFGEYAALLAAHAETHAGAEAEWLAGFADAAPAELPADRPRPGARAPLVAHASRTLGPRLTAGLREASRREGSTLFMSLLGGVMIVLHRLTGQDDVTVGIPSAGRPFPGSGSLVGHCVDLLPVRSPRHAEMRGYLRELRGRLLDAYEHEAFSYARLRERLQGARGQAAPALISVVFNLEPGRAAEGNGPATFAGVEMEQVGAAAVTAKLDVGIDAVEGAEEIELRCTYNSALFDPETIARLLARVERVLEQVAAGGDAPLAALEILDAEERRTVVEAWSGTPAALPEACVHELFARQAAATPDAEALRFAGEGTSYRALDEASSRLAHHLRARGVGPETRVGVFAERAPETVVAILAILKAGGAYVPLDPAYPAERLRFLLEDSGARIVVAPAGIPEGIDHDLVADLLDPRAEAAEIDARPVSPPAVEVSPANVAYVIYTSGSTGRPKGVMVTHAGIPGLALGQIERFRIDASSRVLQFASFSFDAAVSEVFTALLSGATLVLAPRDELLPGPGLLETLRRERITVVTLPPSVLAVLSPDELPDLRTLVSAGEAVGPALVERWSEGRLFINAYGPTETTVGPCVAVCEPDGRTPPIGRPLPGVRVWVLDAAGEPVPVGMPGELYVGGPGVARGYLHRPAQTAERFVPHPFAGGGARLYRTGDRVRWRGDGQLEFLGRVDAQVKVRGFRVEPGEIEAAARRHAGVRDCVVVAREDAPGDRRLVAYVVPHREAGVDLWPSIGEYFVYDELIYHGLTHDTGRNERYLRALRRHAAGRVVLDVGTGADAILARLAVEAGARHVYAVELLERSYLSARARIRELGLEDRVTVIHGDARTVELPEPAEVCVSEIVESLAGGEGAAVILNQARRLLAPGAAMIPGWTRTMMAAATLPDEVRLRPAFSRLAADYVRRIFAEVGHPFDLRLCVRGFPAANLLSAPGTFEDLDFSAGPVSPEYTRVEELEIREDGRLDGLLLWLRMQLAEGEVLDGMEEETAWLPAWFPLFDPGIQVRAGDRLRVECRGVLPDGGVAPDYGARGVLLRVDGSEVPFDFLSVHHARVYKGSPFYRRLFAHGEVPLRDDSGGALPAALREHLRERLPEHMVPSAFVVLDALPLTPNGKLDRAALPAPDRLAGAAAAPPRTPVEEVLAGIWAEVLWSDEVGVHDDFFALGGDSLLATRVVARAGALLGVDLSVPALFEAPTVARLAAKVEELRRAGLPQLPPVVPVPRDRALPLSFAQERLWFLDRLQPGSAFYTIPAALRLEGELDVAALERALGQVVRRHEVLRTAFPEADGAPVQAVSPFAGFTLPVDDLSALDAGERDAEAARRASDEAARPFDLAAGPLFRARLLRLGDDAHVLLLSMHHTVSDGWSMGVLFRELSALYEAERGGEPALPALPVQYADYAVWQRGVLQGELLDRELAWWRERLTGAPALLELPTDHPRQAVQTYRGAYERVELPAALAARLRTLGRGEGATLFMVVLAAFQVLLGRYAGSDDVVVGTPVAGRTRGEVEDLVGLFANTLVLRTALDGDPSFRALLARVRAVTLGAYEHAEVPFEKLVEALHPERTLSHAPLFQVMFRLQEAGRAPAAMLGGVRAQGVEMSFAHVKFDLSLALSAHEGGLTGSLAYATGLFERATIQRLAGHLERVLEQVADDPDLPLSRLELLGGEERRRVLEEWSGAEAPYPSDTTLPALVEAQARRTPHLVALAAEGERLTYAEMEARANRLAHRLLEMGVAPEERVALCLEMGIDAIVGLLGIMKAGAAYLPLDPAAPAERTAFMLDESGARVVVTSPALADRPWGDRARVVMDGDAGLSGFPETAPAVGTTSRHLAYLLYTSGSTGRPKGVLVEHRGVCNSATAFARVHDIGEGDRMLLLAPLHFDSSVVEMFATLTTGAELHLPRGAAFFPGAEQLQLLERERITHAKFTPSSLAALPHGPLPHLRTVSAGGEACTAELVERWKDGRRFLNFYGPTETSVRVTFHECGGDEGAPPLGRPIPNARLYVVDAAMRPLPAGMPGELCIGGVPVTRGYLGRAALTAERFVPDPFGTQPGARLYRTGDRARWRSDGKMEYLARLDGQVKIRGFRIETGEIEALLRRAPGVAECVVVAREDEPGDRRLVAYVVGSAPVDALKAALRERLPEYMVPAAFVYLPQLPLMASGKLDRHALPAPEQGDAEELAPPRTPVEEVLAGAWAELLRVPRVGIDENFFALGGHSLLATRLLSRVRQLFGVEVPLRGLFEAPTVAGLAAEVEALRRDGAPAPPPIVPVDRSEPIPLSSSQERLWFVDRLEGGSPFYNIPAALRLRGALDEAALERALGEVVRRHEALRTTFAEEGGRAIQVVSPVSSFALPVVDLSALPADEREAELLRLADEDAARPFDLVAGPLFRARLLRLGDDDRVLLLCTHHVVSDGWSTGILFRELWTLYDAFSQDRPSPLAELPVQYADFAVWQRARLNGPAFEAELAWWRERLAGAPALLALPLDHPRPAVQSYRGARERIDLPADLAERLAALARREGATPFMVLLAAFQVLLGRYAGSDDVVVGTPVAGRTRREVEGVIGFFVNSLVLRTDLSGDPSFREVLRRVRDVTLGAYDHQEVPFERLVAELQPERSLGHSPLFQAVFNLATVEAGGRTLREVSVGGVDAQSRFTRFDLTLDLAVHAGGISGDLEYATSLFEAATIRRMLTHLSRLLEQVADDADARLSQLELMDESERNRVVLEWNDTARPFPRDATIPQLFDRQVAERPGAVATVWGDAETTYAELASQANRLAHHLQRLGVGPESRVGVMMERGPELIVSILAILKAGGCYVPLDPAYPAERLALMVEDAAVRVVLTRGDSGDSGDVGDSVDAEDAIAAAGARIVALGSIDLSAEPEDAPACGATPECLAYIVYTSGSTGRPKGVMVGHREVVQLVVETDFVHLRPGDRVAQASNANFDALAFEVWGALLNGATLVGIPRDVLLSPPALRTLLRDQRITTLYQTTALLNQLSREIPDIFATLREVLHGGQAVDAGSIRRLLKSGKPQRLLHVYGPTETTAWCSYEDVRHVADDALTVSVGRPIGNARIYILDAHLNPVPAGVPGEAYVGGEGVVRGYLDRPALTAERFVPDPFALRAGARMYRTGDRMRWLDDGTLEFVGRLDEQVKIRGFRIEPGEVESALAACEGVREARVVVREDEPGEKRLVAYVVGDADAEALKGHLRRTMPEYMVPAAIVSIPRIPLTPSGKLDTRALPAPELASAEGFIAPRTPAEEVLAEIWAEVLRVERVGATDDFFALGGHSLLIMRLIARMQEVFELDFSIRTVFAMPTLEAMAAEVERRVVADVAELADDEAELLAGASAAAER